MFSSNIYLNLIIFSRVIKKMVDLNMKYLMAANTVKLETIFSLELNDFLNTIRFNFNYIYLFFILYFYLL